MLPNDLDNAVNGGGVTLWKNLGNGKFTEVTEKAGFAKATGWTLDLGHARPQQRRSAGRLPGLRLRHRSHVFNNGDGTFREVTEKAIGFDTRKGMNVDIADYDNDGWLDIYVTNITDEYMKECNMLWHNNHDGTFTDISKETGTCATLWGWSAKFGDFDNDGWVDLFVVNGLRSGSKENYIPVLLPMITTPGVDFTDVRNWPKIGDMTWSGYQKKKLFRNLSGQAFKEISGEAGVDNDRDGRGIGMGDFDNDGKLDLYQTNADQDPHLLPQRKRGHGQLGAVQSDRHQIEPRRHRRPHQDHGGRARRRSARSTAATATPGRARSAPTSASAPRRRSTRWRSAGRAEGGQARTAAGEQARESGGGQGNRPMKRGIAYPRRNGGGGARAAVERCHR